MAKTTRFDSDFHVEGSADVSGDFEVGGTLYGDVEGGVAAGAVTADSLVVDTDTLVVNTDSEIGFFGAVPVLQQNVPLTTPSAQNIIDALVALGLVEQSD